MNPLLEQFISEARDFLQGIAEKLMQLENAPADQELMTELFRLVHTLKGNSGLFAFTEMTRVLHAGEDLMDAVRRGEVAYSQTLADRLLEAMDFVGVLCDEIERNEAIAAHFGGDSIRLAENLRALLGNRVSVAAASSAAADAPVAPINIQHASLEVSTLPEAARMAAYRAACAGGSLHSVVYRPDEQCFFSGEDPFFLARQTAGVLWGQIVAREPWPKVAELDAYRCVLDFQLVSSAPLSELEAHFRYVAEQVALTPIVPLALILPQGSVDGTVDEAFVSEAAALLQAGKLAELAVAVDAKLQQSQVEHWSASALRWLQLILAVDAGNTQLLTGLIEALRTLETPNWSDIAASNPSNGLSEAERAVVANLLQIQRNILSLPLGADWQLGRMQAASASIASLLQHSGRSDELPALQAATQKAIEAANTAPLLAWFDPSSEPAPVQAAAPAPVDTPAAPTADAPDAKFGRRADDGKADHRSLKVDQAKVDRLMSLIGEIVVAKNALPYLASRAETVFGSRELSREIKSQYTVINRIAEEMQDAIMQVRMMPVSFVFQRFPRLVRDLSRKLGKDVQLVLEGEETEADKNIIEALGDPLMHIVRNSLDHGFELPAARVAAGKPASGTLKIRAAQEADRVVIEIQDDGKGIDPAAVKLKAWQKGLIDEATMKRLSDQEAVNLVFAAGFSTADVISDVSGRGVGMDVVRTAVENVNGSITLDSVVGRGTRIRMALPLSMAVSNVMIIESDGQVFGVPIDCVVESVRVPRGDIRQIKQSLATVLRQRIVPLKSINQLLGLAAPPVTNADDEYAVLVVRIGDDVVGLLVDAFHETVDIILKPLAGVLKQLRGYAGSALLGDGTVLMVLNIKELF